MTLNELDFTKMTDKDVFEAKLKGDVKFGYISSAKRKRFLYFCENAGFIELAGRVRTHMAYRANTDFSYRTMGRYHSETKVVKQGDYLVFDERSRPNHHVKQEHNSEQSKKLLKMIMEHEEEKDD